ncbi:MAG: SpoIIE family protein phosphatase [Coriobacteriia bacterium]|nr:SpoIIE family protein phosphatase [Coriobacteriia bacterium]
MQPLAEVLETLDQVLGGSPDLVMVVTPEHEFAYANRAVGRVTGRPEEVAGKSWRELGVPPDVMARFFRRIDAVVRSHQPSKGEMRTPPELGSRCFEYSFSPVCSREGELLAVACIVHDVTEERVMQEELERALGRAELLQRVALATSEGMSLEEVAEEILCAIRDSLGLCAGDISVYDADEERLRMVACFGYAEPMLWRLRVHPLNESNLLTIRAIRERRTLSHEDEELAPEQAPMVNTRYVTMPLFFRGELVGTCSLGFQGRRPFAEDEMELFDVLSVVIARAVENARIIELERRTSETLQEAYMRRPTEIPGVGFEDEYVSAGTVSRIAGDFYDLFPLDDGHVAVAIGDVAGKGLKAAALTTVVKATLRTHLYEGDTPEVAAEKANEMIWRSSGPEVFATAFIGILDTADGRLSYCNAGHPPALLKRAGGSVEELLAASPILGAFRDLRWDCRYERMGPGDVLLLYTDGVTEAECDGGRYGEERLRSLLERWHGGVEGLPDEVLAAVRECNGELRDDAAVLALRLAEDSAPGASAPPPTAG